MLLQKKEIIKKKKCKNNKRAHAFKGYASTYNVQVLNSFNPELQLKGTESASRNKLKKIIV